ncbi:MAG: PSD1 and planctomycete cytochrome C domain-containing protein [Planctomycetales bacterium]
MDLSSLRPSSRFARLIVRVCCGMSPLLLLSAGPVVADKVDFTRQVRPILSNHCFHCHGPDAHERKGELRLDTPEGMKSLSAETEKGKPGDPQEHELVRRILSTDPDEVMPPAGTQKTLTAHEKDILKRWVAQGAEYKLHWSLVAPKRSELPVVKNYPWLKNPVDQFILARLEKEGLAPAPEADKITLIRRVTFDLTGLPPTPAEVDAFVEDESPDAYERLVERLLQSPHFGERMGLEWLDASRYADTHGYHIDSGRDMTRWREWVIEAFNNNKPFDEFTIEQLAGDLLPNSTVTQKIASGYLRNHMINYEGGAIPEEYFNAYIVDRVNTTGTVYLGMSVACGQCHDHKYDPISQKEYYQLYAFFHNVPENGIDGRKGNATPVLRFPSDLDKEKQAALQQQVNELDQKLQGAEAVNNAAQKIWEQQQLQPAQPVNWTVVKATSAKGLQGTQLELQSDGCYLAKGENPRNDTYEFHLPATLSKITGVRIEVFADEALNAKGPGRSSNGNLVLSEVRFGAGATAASAKPISFGAAQADFSQARHPAENVFDDNPETGWGIHPEVGKDHTLVLELAQPLAVSASDPLVLRLEFLTKNPQHQPGKVRISFTDARRPRDGEKLPANILAVIQVPAEKRTAQQATELQNYYREKISLSLSDLRNRLKQTRQKLDELEQGIPSAMVMEEMPTPRDTFILTRGQYDKKGEKVTAAVPAIFPPIPKDAPKNRLGLAKWLVSPEQPLVARVTVNRYWQMFFGTGLVKTAEDFGSQGEFPSHPELLDWLAVEFRDPIVPLPDEEPHAWDIKHVVRLLVTSATYRQSSHVTTELLQRDPENRLLARGSRFRLPAEFIRDQALAVSGLLNPRIGGPSVSPYQPAGLWEELTAREDGKNFTAQTYSQSHGADLYRRGMYTFWKRTAPPPTLVTFDAPDRETCTVRRSRTNTPLQALILMNDPTYVEAARKFAERILHSPATETAKRIEFAYRCALSRPPSEKERATLEMLVAKQRQKFQAHPAEAEKLLAIGESPRDAKLATDELAAWTTVASVLLNLDETITRN